MKHFTIYNSDGNIKRSGWCSEDDYAFQPQVGEFILEGNFSPLDYYILNDLPELRPAQPTTLNKLTLTADGIDTITISNAPNGIFTATNTTTHETVSGAINGTDTFSTTIQGTYKIKIESWPFLGFEATINGI